MLKSKKWLFVTFYTTAGAMKLEKVCKQAGCPGKLVPVPRSLTSDCGIAWRSEPDDRPRLEPLLAGLEIAGVFEAEQ